ncbi:phage baseplate protein [Xylella taiwanensis]|nr:GPW/gp25 family protein [Xylella taiwanensis]AXI83131.1 phage baseplate protein [Xylella taiwanensis]NBI35778.1 phage baseplate protein [Xylella taiwanensis]QKD98106.1 phage baseplate protein [Xylella taiwanensis]
MRGMNSHTGKPLDGIEHLRQSVQDILSTPLGSRVMRRDDGSRLPELLDAPITRALQMHLYAATAHALAAHEPRLTLQRVTARVTASGAVVLDLSARYLPAGRTIALDGIQVR